MSYDLQRALKRVKEFTLNEEKRGVLVRCARFGGPESLPVPALETLSFPRDMKVRMDAVIANFARSWEAHSALDDDDLPSLKPFLGIAEHSCFLGGEVTYGGDTSYQTPVLKDLKDWRSLRFDENRPHYKLLLDSMAYLKEKSREYGYFVSLRGFDGPMDIANAIRGNDLLYDFYDDPDEVLAFTDFCADGCLFTSDCQRRYADKVADGYISGMGLWLPGNAIGHLSEDASSLCSPAMYEKFGLPFTERVLSGFDSSMLHVHSLGRACIPLFRKLDKFRIIQITDDPNQPTAMQVYREYERELDSVIVNLDLSAEAFRENLSFLKSHRAIVNLYAPNLDEAKRCLDLAREA